MEKFNWDDVGDTATCVRCGIRAGKHQWKDGACPNNKHGYVTDTAFLKKEAQPTVLPKKACICCGKQEARPKRSYCSEVCWKKSAQDAYDTIHDELNTVEFTTIWDHGEVIDHPSWIGNVKEYKPVPKHAITCLAGDWADDTENL